jgi:hypothetical protein
MSHPEGLQHSYGPEAIGEQTNAPEVYHPPAALEHNPNAQSYHPNGGYQGSYEVKPEATVHEKEAVTAKRKILGLPVALFWTIVGLVIVLVLGVALGAGLGAGLRHGDSASSTTTSTSPSATAAQATTPSAPATKTSTTRSATAQPSPTASFVTSGTHGLAANSCNSTDPKNYFAPDGTEFTEYCFTDWPNGGAAADGQSPVQDLDTVTVYTFEDCMQQCLDFNSGLSGNDTQCHAVTYNSNLTSILEVGQQGGDCFLKNKRGSSQGTGSLFSACAVVVD